MNRGLLWFRTDLRLSDNLALQAAMENHSEIVPVYILDEQWLGEDDYGFQRTGAYRMQFLLECLADLKAHLQETGSDLIIEKGNPAEIIPQIAEKYGCSEVYCMKEYTSEEIKRERTLSKTYHLNFFHNSTLIHPEDVSFDIGKLPEVFTTFKKKVEKYSEVRAVSSSPKSVESPVLEATEIPKITDFGFTDVKKDKRAVMQFKGGAKAAWARIDDYFWEKEGLSEYKETRNGLIGADYSSKFSVWLAHGCISARSIYQEVEQYEKEVEKNKSTYWMKFELLWRDFFKYTAMRYGNGIFKASGIKNKEKKWRHNPKTMQKWLDGETGDRFVDANMIELKETGFMSNRGRQNVASYLVHQLGQDWRVGAAWFESQLIDYDVTSNYGNWIYAAGVGNDPRDRVFNTKRQADMYDKNGAFRELWLK
ncbi:MAG: deoxyribodipyrimidine photo-lyase [Paraglaciecola sp.]|jgi:deoxyribodipyrimidine photo-lyase